MSRRMRKHDIVDLAEIITKHNKLKKKQQQQKSKNKTNQSRKGRIMMLSKSVRMGLPVVSTSSTKQRRRTGTKRSSNRTSRVSRRRSSSTASDPAIAELIRQVVSDVNVNEAMEKRPELREPQVLLREFDRAVANLNEDDLDYGSFEKYIRHEAEDEQMESAIESGEESTANSNIEESNRVQSNKAQTSRALTSSRAQSSRAQSSRAHSSRAHSSNRAPSTRAQATCVLCIFCGKPTKHNLQDVEPMDNLEPAVDNYESDQTQPDNYESDHLTADEEIEDDEDMDNQHDDDEDFDDNDDVNQEETK